MTKDLEQKNPSHKKSLLWQMVYIWAGLLLLESVFLKSNQLIISLGKFAGVLLLLVFIGKGAIQNFRSKDYPILFFKFALIIFILYQFTGKFIPLIANISS